MHIDYLFLFIINFLRLFSKRVLNIQKIENSQLLFDDNYIVK